jgi:hypothetical protein
MATIAANLVDHSELPKIELSDITQENVDATVRTLAIEQKWTELANYLSKLSQKDQDCVHLAMAKLRSLSPFFCVHLTPPLATLFSAHLVDRMCFA